jgi:Fanconi anemia group M protein
MIELINIEPREYQKNIAETATKRNTLVVLPTGIGKTLIAVIVALKRLEKFPDSKILIMAPTRPLNAQHKKSFEKFTTIEPEKIVLVTGKINPTEREAIYKNAAVIVATPQTVRNDLKSGKINLKDFSFAIFDEAHRSVKDYAYTEVARKYKEQAENPLILGLTASPGGNVEKIGLIRDSLFIEEIEIRTELEEDVKKYVKETVKDCIYVDFPEEFQMIKGLIENVLKDVLYWLKEHHFTASYHPSKTQLLMLQKRIGAQYSKTRNFALVWALIRSAQAIKLEHAIELIETQGVSSLNEYFQKVSTSKKNTDRRMLKDRRVQEIIQRVKNLAESGMEHPKMEQIKILIKDLIAQNPKIKIIVFANFRSTVERIKNMLQHEGIKTEILIGQTMKEGRGMTQQEQIETLKRFGEGEFNVLVGSSISEEGLDVPAVNYAIFYEAVPSEIRSIQRRGRVGRQTSGKIIFMLTKGTRDEAYFHSALHKEKKMRRILEDMRNGIKKKEKLKDWL